jgi:hypothetical protein
MRLSEVRCGSGRLSQQVDLSFLQLPKRRGAFQAPVPARWRLGNRHSSRAATKGQVTDLPYRGTSCLLSFVVGMALSATLSAQAPAARPPGVTPATVGAAPAVNWVLPIFSDKEGFRSMTLRGSEVRPAGKSIAVTDLSITIFSGDANAHVDTILLSPAAVFSPKDNRATGDRAVRLIRDDIEVTGVGWSYDHDAKKVSLQQNVRVTFHAQLNDILK